MDYNNDKIRCQELVKELNTIVCDQIGKFARPKHILIVQDLPKTRSGKIMRRILRKVADHHTDQLGDLSTLAAPEVVDQLIHERKQQIES